MEKDPRTSCKLAVPLLAEQANPYQRGPGYYTVHEVLKLAGFVGS
jgi:hypothetical protein